jgi:hypothetical protein
MWLSSQYQPTLQVNYFKVIRTRQSPEKDIHAFLGTCQVSKELFAHMFGCNLYWCDVTDLVRDRARMHAGLYGRFVCS